MKTGSLYKNVNRVAKIMFALVFSSALSVLAATAGGIPNPKAVFADAAAVWHLADLNSADGKSPLKLHGTVKVGVELKSAELNASLARGGDGKAAEIAGGWLDAGQGGMDGSISRVTR